MIARVVSAEGATDVEVFRAALRAYRDPNVATVTIHKKGAYLRIPDDKETLVVVEPFHSDTEPVTQN